MKYKKIIGERIQKKGQVDLEVKVKAEKKVNKSIYLIDF